MFVTVYSKCTTSYIPHTLTTLLLNGRDLFTVLLVSVTLGFFLIPMTSVMQHWRQHPFWKVFQHHWLPDHSYRLMHVFSLLSHRSASLDIQQQLCLTTYKICDPCILSCWQLGLTVSPPLICTVVEACRNERYLKFCFLFFYWNHS